MKYLRLQRYINKLKPQTIIVDIFDTILLRRPKPELWRFYELAKLSTEEYKKVGLNTTPLYLLSQRIYISSTLRAQNKMTGFDNETTHRAILQAIIADTARRQNKKLSANAVDKLYRRLHQIEIGYEIDQLALNKPLHKILQTAKSNKVKIYFVSDMYLEYRDLHNLLLKFKVKYFGGGISSADTLYGKASGKSFIELTHKYPSIKLNTSLYIGDQFRADSVRPKQFGLQTKWLAMPLHRSILLLGKIVFGTALKFLMVKEKLNQGRMQKIQLRKLFSKSIMNTQKEAQFLGWLFAPALIYYLHQLGLRSQVSQKQIVFVTSESNSLQSFYGRLGFTASKKLPKLNRTSLIQAYSYILTKKGLELTEILPMVQKILRRKDTTSALLTLGILPYTNKQHHLLGKSILSLKSLNKIDTRAAIKDWQQKHSLVLKDWRALKVPNSSKVMISDIGWNDTIQILLKEILVENNHNSTDLEGVYLGRTGANIFDPAIPTSSTGIIFNSLKSRKSKYLYQPEVWESFLNNDNIGKETREDIIAGISQAIDYYNSSFLTAQQFYNYNQKILYRALKKPSRRMIEVLSSLEFDYGTASEPVCPLVNISTKKSLPYKWMLVNRSQFKSFYFHQGWKWGAATYYHFRLVYRLWRSVSKKPSY